MSKVLLILDDGHGMDTPGKRTPPMPGTGKPIQENEFNRPVVEEIKKIFAAYPDVVVYETAHEINNVDLDTRCARANMSYKNAKTSNPAVVGLFVSIHYNAVGNTFEFSPAKGVETFHYPGSIEGVKLATFIHNELIKGTPQTNRGVKQANFQVLRETLMPAVLIEAGFMDELTEAKLMLDPAFHKEVATEVAVGINKYLASKGIFLVPETVKEQTWQEAATQFVIDMGISDGTRPNDPVKRVEVFQMFKNYHDGQQKQ